MTKSTLNWFMLLWRPSHKIPAALNSSTFLWPSSWVSIHRHAATSTHTSTEHIKRAQCLWNQIFQASFLGSWTLIDLISIVRYLFKGAWCWVSKSVEFEHGEVLFSAKNEGFSLRAGDEMGLASPPRRDGFKSTADENEPQCKRTWREKENQTSAWLELAVLKRALHCLI